MTIIFAQTVHYQIEDHGEDYIGRFTHRYALQRKPEFDHSRILSRWAASNDAGALIAPLRAAEQFHIEQQAYCNMTFDAAKPNELMAAE